jgi:hydroxyacyl-ACP dehydratase HTD2-like protein with hotdog domain
MPQGYHLIYFPPQIPESLLLPDGTDPLQSPGTPWVRRLWAGGSVEWNPDPARTLRLRGQRAVCIENITDVVMKGKGDAEKVFVTIERRVGEIEEGTVEEDVRRQLSGEEAAMVEKRIIVFMRERTVGEAAAAAAAPGKVVKRMSPMSTISS